MKGFVSRAVEPEGMGMTPVVTAKIVCILLIMVNFFIPVAVMEQIDLSAVQHKDSIFVHMNTNGLIKTSGITLPCDIFQILIDPFYQPNISG